MTRACLRIALIRPGASASGQSLSARLDTARTGKLTRPTIAGAGMGTADAIASRSADGGGAPPTRVVDASRACGVAARGARL